MSVLVNTIRAGFYLDSVALMRLSVRLEGLDGVQRASLMLASPANRQILRDAGLLSAEGSAAGADDLVIAVRADDQAHADTALESAQAWIKGGGASPAGQDNSSHQPRSLDAAVTLAADANLALVSVPGEYAAGQAHKALDRGLNVMIFSDNVAVEDELALKRKARAQGLIVMGPDCGTAIINGVPLAFANVVPSGSVGLIAASGTGLQEVSCLLAREGVGISHAIGTGGRDLSDDIGAITTLSAIEQLASDDKTSQIVLISKPPGPATAARVLADLTRAWASCAKPVTVCFIGMARPDDVPEGLTFCSTLHDTAQAILGGAAISSPADTTTATATATASTGVLHGLFAGGTLCAEAQVVCANNALAFASNAPIPGAERYRPGDAGNKLIDLGADEYTVGRPHPMLEPQVRSEVLRESLQSADVILLDVVLGFGSHADPAGAVADVVASTQTQRRPVVVASVCGTDADPQVRHQQVRKLQQAGIQVADSNAQATQQAIDALMTVGAKA